MREVSGQNTFNGHNSLRVHFGLKDAVKIDSLIINWPASPIQVLENIDANEIINITEPLKDNFLRVNFKSEVLFGFDLPQIQFADLSESDPNKQIVSWEWDFNNDGIVDATEQNPTWQYDSLGTYSVKLAVSNGIETIERLKQNYITLVPKPGIPTISSVSPLFGDTTVSKGEQINFSAIAFDTTGYEITYEWILNSTTVDRDSTYRYRARTFPFIPRTDTLILSVSNGFNINQTQWLINVEDVTSVNTDDGIPETYGLNQNYPNPFNPSTIISYQLPEMSNVSIKVFDVLGRELITLINETQDPGYYHLDFNAKSLSSGIYFYKISSGNYASSKKMILLK